MQAGKSSTAKLQAMKVAAADAKRSLQACQEAERRSRGREESVSAEARELRQEKLNQEKDSDSGNGALRTAEQRLAGLEKAAASDKEVNNV